MTAESSFEIRVVCYCGYRGEETPRRFYFDKRPIEVAEVLDRWLAPDHRYFKVRCPAGDRYILRHNTRADIWELTLFESRHKPPEL
jgi:hypothetical protein